MIFLSKQDVYKALEKYALADTAHERGTIILGEYYEELGKTHVIISNYIEAKYTDASASTLTFTHETWDYVHKQHDKLYPEKKIVGWQHTHPNYGIFLSNYDLFIHENFFNLPFQVAYVIDPIQNIRGFFQWKNGRIEKLKGYYIYDDIGKPIKIEQSRAKSERKTEKHKTEKLPAVLLSILCVCSVVFAFMFSSINKQLNTYKNEQEQLKQTIAIQDYTIKDLQNQVSYHNEDSENITIEDLIEQIKNQKIQIEEQEEIIAELQAYIDNKQNGSETSLVIFVSYTVKSGDSLRTICNTLDIDYLTNIEIIKSINGIEDENKIYVGQSILIPIYINQ